MLNTIGNVSHIFALLALAVVVLYFVSGGEEGKLLLNIFGRGSVISVVLKISIAFLVVELPFSIYLHYRNKRLNDNSNQDGQVT